MLLGFDIEIIIADDGSKIKSNEILQNIERMALKLNISGNLTRFQASKLEI